MRQSTLKLPCWLRVLCVAAALAIMALPSARAQASQSPKFKDYPAPIWRSGSVAPDLTSPDAKQYHSRLKAAKRQKPNFGGHYVLIQWGCGAQCRTGAVVDAKTGEVIFLPGNATAWGLNDEPFYYKADSRLFVFAGHFNEADDYTVTYYTIGKDGFEFVSRIVVPDATGAAAIAPQAGPTGGANAFNGDPLAKDPKIGPLILCYEAAYERAIGTVAKNAASEKDYVLSLLVVGGPTRLAATAQSYCDPGYRQADIPGADKEANIRAIGPLFLAYITRQELKWLSACEGRGSDSEWRDVAEQCTHFRSLRYKDRE